MITFGDCIIACLNNPEFLHHYDRLRGSNISMRGSALDIQIDIATGRMEADVKRFLEDVYDLVYARLPIPQTKIGPPSHPENGEPV